MPDTELAIVRHSSSPISPRAEEVLDQIMNIKSTLMKRSLELGRLLKEARDNHYAQEWGFSRFDDWVEEGSGLDMSARLAYDLIKVVEQSFRLGIPDEALERVKLSKLKVIFTLKAGEMSDDDIRELVTSAELMTTKDIAASVGIAKHQEWVYRNYKFDKTAYEQVITPATERAIREYGDTLGVDEQVTDISDSKAVEIWAASFLAEPEPEYGEPIDAEFEDSFEADSAFEVEAA